MGRHSLPDHPRAGAPGPRPRARRRSVAIATVLVLTVAGGTAVVVRGGLLSFGASCRDRAVRLDLAASPDIAPSLKAAADRARDENVTSDGRCLDVRVRARDSSEVADDLRSGGKPDVQVWVPDSDVWVQRVSADTTSTRLTRAGNVASSPVGVAVVPSAAKSLGWPEKTYTWTELAGATLQDDRLRLGAADASRSATGLLALTRLTTAAAGTKDGGTQAAAMAKLLSQRTVDSDSQVLATLPRDASGSEQGNPKRNQALLLSEQSAYTHNASADADEHLRLFYPKDGAPRLDYPFTLVDDARLTTDESRAALRFMTLLDSTEGRALLTERGFRLEGKDASTALVTRAGGRAPQPYDDDPPEPDPAPAVQEALGMWTITVQSARITTVVDASASMAEPVPGTGRTRMDVTKASLLEALATFTSEDEIGLWEFSTKLDGNRDYKVLVPTKRLGDRVGDGTQRDRLSAAFTSLAPVPEGATGLYDTTLAAYEEAVSSYAKGKFNALVILTDGVNEDPGSISRSTLVSELQKATDPTRPVPLIAIAVGPEADKTELNQTAKAAGGSGHQVSNPSQIQSVILKAIVQAGSQT
ncbi:substrate-binding and VWA domain-containing protein [Streptomyces spongiae]|uniref:VWA domain-containing protein n=1 Tax=Streptomyces spongiae TaxID=565072 RepID=A0A5N8XUJ1_9ACTN|nr:substrate-binding and VWA domain-containing protein [Streptomyces spongiae]MPY63051.1 VWA domain-containing protein [Streptomyces spongiae]